MTAAEMKAFFADVKYRPNWTIQVSAPMRDFYGNGQHFPVDVFAAVKDAYGPGDVVVTHTRLLPLYVLEGPDAEARLLDFLFHLLLDIERHEAGEFFQYRGKRPFDPHKGEK